MRDRIELNTTSDVLKFVKIVSKLPGEVWLEDASGKYKVSAASFLGALYSLEWNNTYVVATENIFQHIAEFVK